MRYINNIVITFRGWPAVMVMLALSLFFIEGLIGAASLLVSLFK